MIDDEADFGNIIDAPAEVQTAAKFRPKARVKPRKPSVPSRSLVPTTVEKTDEKVGALSQANVSQEHSINQETTSLACLASKTFGDGTAFRGILDMPSEDGLTVSLGPVSNPDVTLDSSTGGVTAVDRVSQNEEHSDVLPKVATHQENLVVSDTQASSTSSSGKTIDDLADFGGLFDTQVEEERVAKFQPNIHVKLSKAASKSKMTNQKAGASTVDVVLQNKEDGNNQTGCNDEQLQDPRYQESVQTSESQASLGTDNSTVDDLANLDCILEEPVQEEMAAKFRPKLRAKPGRASSRVAGTNDKAAVAAPVVGFYDVDVVSRDTEDDRHGQGHNDDLWQKPTDQEAITVPDTWPPQDVDATVDLETHDELINAHPDGTQSIFGEPSAEATVKFQPNVGRKKRKGKSVSFVLPDASEGAGPTDTNSEMSNFSHNCNDIATDEILNNSPQQTAEKHPITEEQHSNYREYTERQSQHEEGEPSDHAVEQQPNFDVGEVLLSMKLRSRKKLQKVGIPEHTADVNFDGDYVEPSAAEHDNDSGDEYIAGGKQKVRRKSREKDINKEPLRGSKHTSKDSPIEDSQQQKLQKNKSNVSSQGRKRTLKDTSTEQPERKLTHRIRQKRMKEVKTLLETPDHEIDRMKLSVAHLRLLQEARERIKGKEIPSGPSSNQSSSQLGDTDDFDFFGDKELENYDNDRTENHILENATKLNYHSYMNKQSRAKWSKSDTDLFYQGLRQFGSDFAMIQQLFPDKTRDQVRKKFKTEEKKNPMLVHDAIIHRSRDNLYFRKVIKQLNIEDVRPEINSIHKQDGASNEGDFGNENVLDDFIIEEEENGSNWSDKEQGTHRSEVKEGEHVSANADDDLDDVFDWY